MLKIVLAALPLLLLAAPDEGQPQAAQLKGNLARGRALFEEICAECHNSDSKDDRVGPGLKGLKDGKLPDGNKATRDKLIDIVNRGPAEMPSFKDRLSEQEKADVVDFALTL